MLLELLVFDPLFSHLWGRLIILTAMLIPIDEGDIYAPLSVAGIVEIMIVGVAIATRPSHAQGFDGGGNSTVLGGKLVILPTTFP